MILVIGGTGNVGRQVVAGLGSTGPSCVLFATVAALASCSAT